MSLSFIFFTQIRVSPLPQMSELAKKRHEQYLRDHPQSIPRALFMSHQGLKHAQEHLVTSRCVRYAAVASIISVPIVLFLLLHWVYHSVFHPDYYTR